MKNHQLTSFYLEALLLVIAFVAMILVLTGVFGAARAQSAAARQLTKAVELAANAAEAVAAADSPEQTAEILDEGGNVRLSERLLEAFYRADGSPCTEKAALRLTVRFETDTRDPALTLCRIEVFEGDGGEPVYRLETASYGRGAAA